MEKGDAQKGQIFQHVVGQIQQAEGLERPAMLVQAGRQAVVLQFQHCIGKENREKTFGFEICGRRRRHNISKADPLPIPCEVVQNILNKAGFRSASSAQPLQYSKLWPLHVSYLPSLLKDLPSGATGIMQHSHEKLTCTCLRVLYPELVQPFTRKASRPPIPCRAGQSTKASKLVRAQCSAVTVQMRAGSTSVPTPSSPSRLLLPCMQGASLARYRCWLYMCTGVCRRLQPTRGHPKRLSTRQAICPASG